ncbi:AAA family ATPase, partial [Candidatus Sumerlaeota bacterium]|nr:AAA family ATPase [Candidatus Sumerlaeota bacterium]
MKECPQCYYDVYLDTPVCPICGAALENRIKAPSKPGEKSPAAQFAALAGENHVQRLIEKFEEKGVPLSGEILRRISDTLLSAKKEMPRVTVMIAEISRESSSAHPLPVKSNSRIEKEFYRIILESVIQRGGVPVEIVDNAITFLFGAPFAFDSDTKSAVFAALDIRRFSEPFSGNDRAPGIRIGIATGAIPPLDISSPSNNIAQLAGGAVHLALRLQKSADAGEILACPATWEVAKRAFDAEPIPLFHLKDLMDDYIAYKISGIKQKSAEAQKSYDAAPFFGRKKELDALFQILSDQKPPGAHIIHISGAEGIGKTRLLYEALSRTGKLAETIWWQTEETASSILFFPVIQWLRGEMNLSLNDSMDLITARIREFIAKRFSGKDANPILLEYIFGAPEALAQLRSASSENLQDNLFALLRRILFQSGEG